MMNEDNGENTQHHEWLNLVLNLKVCSKELQVKYLIKLLNQKFKLFKKSGCSFDQI